VSREDLHRHVGIVNQNPDLFNTSLRDNIGYGGVGSEEATDEQVEAAAKLANCGFISNFRGGLDTFAGTGGSGLSGGQKQRIAIARAALRGPSILVLDEATSSLDTENEAQVQEALERLMRGRTTIIIAHRLSTIKGADEIVVLEGGRVVERGGHAELLQLGGVYRKLVTAQVVSVGEEVKRGTQDMEMQPGCASTTRPGLKRSVSTPADACSRRRTLTRTISAAAPVSQLPEET
jgi:ATP-binding cassette subfamily B protein